MRSLQSHGLVSSLVTQVKVSEGDLSQWINCHLSNEGTECNSHKRGRRTGGQCYRRGSESVVVVGVTTHQGDGSTVHRAKGLRSESFITHSYREVNPLMQGGNTSLLNVAETMKHLHCRSLDWNAVCDESRPHSVVGAFPRPLNVN
jgi:hypothetical protein